MPNPSTLAQAEEKARTPVSNETCEVCPYRLHDGCNGTAADQHNCPMLGNDPVSDALTEEQQKVETLTGALGIVSKDLVEERAKLAKLTEERDALLAYFQANEMLRAQQPSEKIVDLLKKQIDEARERYEKASR